MGKLLKKAVGSGSNANKYPEDVKVVIQLLNKHIQKNVAMVGVSPLDLKLAGNDPQVIAAIEKFQELVVELKKPDGRVDPGGKTIKALQKTPKDAADVVAATFTILNQLIQGPVGGVEADLWNLALTNMLGHLDEPHLVKYDVITIIDYRIPIQKERLWVIDLPGRAVIMNVHVSHGSGRQGAEGGTARANPVFSNTVGSNQSTVGGWVTLHEKMTGLGSLEKIGLPEKGRTLVADGLDDSNSRMKMRGIYIHGASYFDGAKGKFGLSHGCLVTKPDHNNAIIDRIKDGTFGYSYAGEDWM